MDHQTNNGNLIKLAMKSIIIAFCGFLFPFIYIFFPTMYVTESMKQGIVKIAVCFVVVCAIIGAAFGPMVGLVLFNLFGPFILVFHYMIVTKRDVYLTIALCACVFFFSVLFIMYSFGITGEVLNSEGTKQLIVNHIQSMMEANPGNAANISLSGQDVLGIYERCLQILPATLVLISMTISYVTFVLTGRALLVSGRLIPQPGSFEFFQIPQEFVLWGVLSLILLNVFGQDLLGTMSQVIFSNLFTLLLFLLFLQGLSILKYVMSKAGIGTIMQGAFILFVFILSVVQMALVVIGIIDSFINIRKI